MTRRKIIACLLALVLLVVFGLAASGAGGSKEVGPVQATANPALSVSTIRPQIRDLPVKLSANGSIAAWQEAVIGAEIGDLRLSAVNVQVGETVRRGQVLAVFADDSVQADVAQARAVLAEAEANQAEARVNAERATRLASKALSAQQVDQYLTASKAADAKVKLALAQLDAQLLRLKYTKVVASDDGIISSRGATLGAVATKGQELFRLIRQNRLEWRGEVTAEEMARLKPGGLVVVEVPNVGAVEGVVRFLAPTLDSQSRNGLVYVDLPDAAAKGLRAGMFARGEFLLGAGSALTVPQEALSLRDGFSYVFRLSSQTGELAKVQQLKVQLGRRADDAVEILSGLNPDDRLVASGASFLADGDSVRVVAP